VRFPCCCCQFRLPICLSSQPSHDRPALTPR
jgi:hypothetical protein